MKTKNFAIFILTHGRAGRIKTLTTLRKINYDGDIYLIVDDTDECIDEYYQEKITDVLIFNKDEEAKYTDTIDNFNKRNCVVYSRNVCHRFAKELGLEYFLVLDDDYTFFGYRYEEKGTLKQKNMTGSNFNDTCDMFIEFLEKTNSLTVAMAQGGDFIGGAYGGNWKKGITRKAMNSFFCKTDRPFKFNGTINEDVNAYLTLGATGNLFFTISKASLNQGQTQSNEGGLTEIYLDSGTYVKSFYSVICAPSCVKVVRMGNKNRRIHHKINWANAVPCIIEERYKKNKEE